MLGFCGYEKKIFLNLSNSNRRTENFFFEEREKESGGGFCSGGNTHSTKEFFSKRKRERIWKSTKRYVHIFCGYIFFILNLSNSNGRTEIFFLKKKRQTHGTNTEKEESE